MRRNKGCVHDDNNFWYEYVEFNGWYYGTSYEQFRNTCNLFVMTPKGVEAINPIDRNYDQKFIFAM